jgi:hypothetical protein
MTEIIKDTAGLAKIIRLGGERASAIAKDKLKQVYDKIGFVCTDM